MSKETQSIVLSGNAYNNFIDTIKTTETLWQYKYGLVRFMNFLKITDVDNLVVLAQNTAVLQQKIIDYISYLKKEKTLGGVTINLYLASIFHFYSMNDVVLNRKKIGKYIPEFIKSNNDRAYTRQEIARLLEFCNLQWVDGIVQILYAEEYHRPDYNEMLSTVYSLMSKYDIDSIYVDGANPSFIKSMKLQIGEDPDYDKVIARYKSEGLGDATKDMRIIPVNFNKEHKAMLGHCKMLLEKEGGRIAINPDRFDKLITALRTAVDNDGTLDKELTSYNDIFDAFRLAMKFYHFGDSSSE